MSDDVQEYNVKGTWHYKLMLWIGAYSSVNLPKDFCSYWRNFCVAMFFVLLISAMGAWIVLGTLAGIFYLLAGWVLPDILVVPTTITTVVTNAVLIGTFTHYGGKGLNAMKGKRDPNAKPGILTVKYRAWKDKYCPKVVYK